MENKCKAKLGSYQSLLAAVTGVAVSAGCPTQGESITFGLRVGALAGAGQGSSMQPDSITTVFEYLDSSHALEQLDALARVLYASHSQTDLHHGATCQIPKLGLHRKERRLL